MIGGMLERIKRKRKRIRLRWKINRHKLLITLLHKKEIVTILAGSRLTAKTKNKKNTGRNAPKVEDNAIAMANYIANNYNIPVYFIATKDFKDVAEHLLDSRIRFVKRNSWSSFIKIAQSKYLFFTHRTNVQNISNEQIQINLWHGVGHKKIEKLKKPNSAGIAADYTVVTSRLTQQFMAKAFGVSEESAVITGYPRNDWMLDTQKEKKQVIQRVKELNKFDKVLIWMPTYRPEDKKKECVENVFSIDGFKVDEFQTLLYKHNALCIVKPHHLIKSFKVTEKTPNILFIDDFWIYKNRISLYQLLACTDALITDYSSVMIDYSLLDQPIFCIATDLEDFKAGQGLYFEDYENWVPTKLFKNQNDLLIGIDAFLNTGEDTYQVKRHKVRDLYFKYKDNKSAKRISEIIIKKQ